MTKTKAIKQLRKYNRDVIDPSFALKIAKVFGTTPSKLGLRAKKVNEFYRLNYTKETQNLKAISVYELARQLAVKLYTKEFTNKQEAEKYAKKLNEMVSWQMNSKPLNPYLLDKEQEQAKWWQVMPLIESNMNGQGSYAEDITEKACKLLELIAII